MSSDRGRLGEFLKEVISWRWDEFCKAEKDNAYTGYQSTVFSLVRVCSEGRLGGIRLAIDRVDGKIETPIRIEYPKIYFLYPNATSVAELPEGEPKTVKSEIEVYKPEPEDESTLATISLRETLNKLADYPRVTVQLILQKKLETERMIRDGGITPKDAPLVKSVIAANLLHLAEKSNFEAITEIFDQIDGKLVETIRILGDDIYLTQYMLMASAGAVKNKDGVYQLDATEVTKIWKEKLSK